jgi:hypothetical protein
VRQGLGQSKVAAGHAHDTGSTGSRRRQHSDMNDDLVTKRRTSWAQNSSAREARWKRGLSRDEAGRASEPVGRLKPQMKMRVDVESMFESVSATVDSC